MRPRLLLPVFLLTTPAFAQAPPPATSTQKPVVRFEVASIRPHTDMHSLVEPLSVSSNRITLRGYALGNLIMEAYNLPAYRFSISPAGRRSGGVYDTYFDVVANAEGPEPPSRDQIRAMLRTLLAERFNLRTHTESRELPVYNLVLTKSGPKFKLSGPEVVRSVFHGVNGRNQNITATGESMAQLATDLPGSFFPLLPVLDKTGLTGTYTFKLEATPGAYACDDSRSEDISIFDALQQQLGLKLVPTKAAVSLLVVDHAEPPTAN